MNIKEHNKKLFQMVKDFKFPPSEYAIMGGGPLGIRGLRRASDIDMMVSEKLWEELKEKYTPFIEKGTEKIRINDDFEIFWKDSFKKVEQPRDPSSFEQIDTADTIDSLSFVNLEIVLYYKKKYTREKDIKDIELIENYLKNESNN